MTARGPRGDRLLAAGHVLIRTATAGYVEALVRDGVDVLTVRRTPGAGWACGCTAVTPSCAHVLAVRSLVILGPPITTDEECP